MPISVESSIDGPFIPNGATTDFAFTFKAMAASDVAVVDQEGAALSSALYSVILDDDEGGTVTFSVAPALADYAELYILSDPALTQSYDFSNAGPSFNPAALTQAIDQAAVRDLKQQREIDRGAKAPFGEDGHDLPARSDLVASFLVGDANGNLIPSAGTGADVGLRGDMAADTGSLLIKHKMAGGSTYGRTARQWAVVGGMSDDNIFNWIDSDLDAAIRGSTATTDLVLMFEAAFTALSTIGGDLRLPRGLYPVGKGSAGFYALSLPSNVSLVGEGAGSEIFLLAGEAPCHVVNIDTASNVALRNLAINGNRNNQAGSSHGIKGKDIGGLTLENLLIKDAYSYGIGLQDGTFTNIVLNNVGIDGAGADGIDIKNQNNANEAIQLNAVRVRRWGLRGDLTAQAAIDARGPNTASNIWISEPGAVDAIGYRFRHGETVDPNGFGGHKSSLSDFQIRMGTGGTARYGLVCAARDVHVSNGYILNGTRGVQAQESGFRATGVTVQAASGHGFFLAASGGGLDADGAVLTACKSSDNGGNGFEVETDNCRFGQCEAEGNTGYGLNTAAGANNTRVSGGDYLSNTAGSINDGGTNTQINGVIGYEQTYTVAQLATKITSPVNGQKAFVSDASATTFGSAVAGGGANKVPIYYDGGWKIG